MPGPAVVVPRKGSPGSRPFLPWPARAARMARIACCWRWRSAIARAWPPVPGLVPKLAKELPVYAGLGLGLGLKLLLLLLLLRLGLGDGLDDGPEDQRVRQGELDDLGSLGVEASGSGRLLGNRADPWRGSGRAASAGEGSAGDPTSRGRTRRNLAWSKATGGC